MPTNNHTGTFHVVGGHSEISKMFTRRGWIEEKEERKDVDLLVLTGGADVTPFLYGEQPLKFTNFDPARDLHEIRTIRRYPYMQKKVGICRGAQLLNVLSGGHMWQHVDQHTRDHMIDVEYGLDEGALIKTFRVSSTHHQMMIPSDEAIIVGTAGLATLKERQGHCITLNENKSDDTEIVYYWQTESLCFQPHPEYGPPECTELFFTLVNNILFPVRKGQ